MSSDARQERAAAVIQPTAKHSATVVFLHGLGDIGDSWAKILKEYRSPHIKYICPTAYVMPVSRSNGYKMPSWYDIHAISAEAKEDENGIQEAAKRVHSIIDDEVKQGIPSERIILGGISQGGALALYAGYTYPKPLGGLVAISCWICLRNALPQNNATIPVFQGHGDFDNVVSLQLGEMVSDFIKTFNPTSHTFKIYRGVPHWVSPEELADVKEFIEKHLSA